MKRKERRRWNRMSIVEVLRRMEVGDLPLVLRDGSIWGYEMDMQELQEAYRKAWSFPGLYPPNHARYIGYEKQHTDLYLYWKDSQGNYWYDTKGGMAFKRAMEEKQRAQKKKKMASRRNWMPG